jgi:hypothetical protein
MPQLLSLPSEVIRLIFQQMMPISPNNLPEDPRQLHKWADNVEDWFRNADRSDVYHLLDSILTCRLFRDMATEFLYTNVHIRGASRMLWFIRTIDERRDLHWWVKSVVIELEPFLPTSRTRIERVFTLPRIHTLTVANFPFPEYLDNLGEDGRPATRSPLKSLRLLGCSASSAQVAALLLWPAKLEEFHWDLSLHFSVNERQAIWTGLTPVHQSLKSLTLTASSLPDTRNWFDVYNLGDMSVFTSLTTLRIFNGDIAKQFLWIRGSPHWRKLPRSLEVFQMGSEPSRRDDEMESRYPMFLRALHLGRLDKHLVNLRKVYLWSDPLCRYRTPDLLNTRRGVGLDQIEVIFSPDTWFGKNNDNL